MPDNSSRRQWLRNTATALAGVSLAPSIFATEKERYRAEGKIILDGNENAYGPSATARKAMTDALGNSNRYPDDQVHLLRQQLADFNGVEKENILMGAGSSEFLGLVPLLVSSTKGNIISAEPSYRIWNGQAESFGLTFKRIPVANDKTLSLGEMMSSMDANTRMMFVCNPNNPVGTYIEDNLLRAFVIECSKKCMVFVDEAYTEYANLPSLKDLAAKNQNIVVAKTFSKIYGLAGARIGYVIAHPDIIKKLSAFQPWPNANVSMASAAAASAALKDQAFVKDCKEKAALARQMCYDCFKQLSFEYIPSQTNFILFNIDKIKGDFTKQMEAKNIFVQFRNHFGGKWCRVSMGTIDEMKSFCSALKEIA